jgi:23S rRNA (guanine2445-N2)-methyltransferase / 23S rRNA (guanine2069-N7)-methyltransferase
MFEFLVTTAKGLDELLAKEIANICPDVDLKVKPGQVIFSGTKEHAYRVCLWSRLANRVLLKLGEGEVDTAEQLYQVAGSINWSSHFKLEDTFVVDFRGSNHAINNTQFGALKIKDAIVDQFNDLYGERPSVDKLNPSLRFQGRLWNHNLGIYLDLSGSSLHQRHYRVKTGPAPVKEHIACAMLVRSGWSENQHLPLIDPMCGAGTVAIEAALMVANVAPGINRDSWGFDHWQQHEQSLWDDLLTKAKEQSIVPKCSIVANDIEHRMIAMAKENADLAGVFDFIKFSSMDATKLSHQVQEETGYIVSNPPYGERLSELTALLPLFQNWGAQLKQHFQGWRLSLLTSNRDLLRQMKLVAKREYKLMNGKLECQLVNFELDENNCRIREQTSQSNDFTNRISKNIKRSNNWLKKQNTNCYRIYDGDLPEYNVAIDRYADWLVVQEYAAPKDVPESKAKARLHQVLLSLPQATQIAADNIILKVREQQKGKTQYQRVAEHKQMVEVFENGAKFKVNLRDYLDTGLFLDHRITRELVQKNSRGKDVLNLFAYTGSVSVHAALGGAKSVTTVDMSNTYIDWAKDNFALNNLRGAYEFIQADCLSWLAEHKQKYDLLFIDPPSFSNSKRMDATWDVQRDHVALLKDAVKCLKTGGQIMFSNNLRQFKIDEAGISTLGLDIENISKQTIPEDFQRSPKIHHCWLLTLR